MPFERTAVSFAASAAEDLGVVFPAAAGGRRSTTETGRAIVAAALGAVHPAAADAASRERDWRRNYVVHLRRLVELGLRNPQAAQSIAQAGLHAAATHLQFSRNGSAVPLAQAMQAPATRYATHAVHGASKARPAPLAVPYRGQMLSGDGLRRQLDRWEADGVLEPSFARALWRVQANPDWLDLSDQRFALLGAQAEMAPLPWLVRWRAQVWAVDLPREAVWQKLARLAHAGNGVMHVPLFSAERNVEWTRRAGDDLIIDTPEIAAWLAPVAGPLTVGAYAYLDGALHLRVAAAMDAIQAQLAAAHPAVTLAMLATPTDAYAVPPEAVAAAHAGFAQRGPLARAAAALSLGRGFQCNGVRIDAAGELATDAATNAAASAATNAAADAAAKAAGKDGVQGAASIAGLGGIIDALVVQQGPNYVLAKRLQHWRALVARASGVRVSIHVAPPALTGSVTKNRLIAAAYRAAHRFGAQTFEPATAAALMAALLVHDLRNPESPANPAVPLAHPLQLLTDAACHGGLWRMPYAARSALPAAALLGMLQRA
jgi:hypothetical protein